MTFLWTFSVSQAFLFIQISSHNSLLCHIVIYFFQVFFEGFKLSSFKCLISNWKAVFRRIFNDASCDDVEKVLILISNSNIEGAAAENSEVSQNEQRIFGCYFIVPRSPKSRPQIGSSGRHKFVRPKPGHTSTI